MCVCVRVNVLLSPRMVTRQLVGCTHTERAYISYSS